MSFAAPFFLLAVLAGVIPVLLHMIHSKKAVEIPFSTLRFLKVSVQRTRRKKYLDDLTLLLLRVAALILIALGLAQPKIRGLLGLGGSSSAIAVVLVLDNSASMATVDNGQPRLETARRAAEKVLDSLRSGDAVSLLLTNGPPTPEQDQLFSTHETVRQALAQAHFTYEKADLAIKLHQAREILTRAETPNKEIYILTDNQALSWKNLQTEAEDTQRQVEKIPVVLVNVNRDPVPNVALRHLRLDCPAPTTGVPIQVKVELWNTSAVARQHHLELHVDGQKKTTSPTLNLPSGGVLQHEFVFEVEHGGIHSGEVRLAEEDGSPADNRLFFGLVVDRKIPVAVVKPRGEGIAQMEDSFYLEQALMPTGSEGWAVRLTTLTPEQLLAPTESLSHFAVVFCVNLPGLEPAAAKKLRDYAWGGGHLFWVCGQNVRADTYKDMNEAADGQLLPATVGELRLATAQQKESWQVGFLDPNYPALAPLTEPASLYQSILVWQHFLLVPDDKAAPRILAKLDDGQPLLLERTTGSGSVLMLGSAVHNDWTNLPLRPIFLPLVTRLMFHFAEAPTERSSTLAGVPLMVPLGGGIGPEDVEVTRPSGEKQRQRSQDRTFRYLDTHDVGVYVVRAGDPQDPKSFVFAVNPDPEESDPASLTSRDLKTSFGQRPLEICDDPESIAQTINRLREGTTLWEVFLWIVLVGLVVEVFIANRMVGKKEVDKMKVPGKEKAPTPSVPV